jgi:hypothetical protein
VCREFCKEGWDAGYALEYADFAASVLDGTPLAAAAQSAVADLCVTVAMVQADQEMAWVQVDGSALLPAGGGGDEVPGKL